MNWPSILSGSSLCGVPGRGGLLEEIYPSWSNRSVMGSKVGSVIGLAGGVVVVAGFFMPWGNASFDFQPLRDVLGNSSGAVERVLHTIFHASISGFDVLSLLVQPPPDPRVTADIMPGVYLVVFRGVAAALALAFILLTAVSFAFDLRKTNGPARRVLERLRSGRIWFAASTLAISGLLIAGIGRMSAPVLSVTERLLTSRLGQEEFGLDPGIAGQAAPLLNQVVHFSPGTGLYLCAAGSALAVAGAFMSRKRVSVA